VSNIAVPNRDPVLIFLNLIIQARAIESDIRSRLPESGVCDAAITYPAEADTRSLISVCANLMRLVSSETSIDLLRKKLMVRWKS
jgi:hypothetical protein